MKKWVEFNPINQLTDFSNYRNFVNKVISGENIFFSRKINLELSIVRHYLTKNKALRSQNDGQKFKNDSYSTYAKVQYIVWIGQLGNNID